MQEIKLLSAAASSRDAARELHRFEIHKDLGDAENIVWEEICRFYTTDKNADHIEKSILKERLRAQFPKEDHYEKFDMIVSNLRKVSVPNILDLVREARLETTSRELAVALEDGKHKRVDDLIPVYQGLREGGVDDAEEDVYKAPTHADLVVDKDKSEKILVFPKQLNTTLGGGAHRGNHIFLFARPEVGKTACALTMAYGFLKQKLNVLYLGNEEPKLDVIDRLKARICDKPIDWVRDNPQKTDEVCFARGYGGLIFWEPKENGGTIAELQRRMAVHKPDVVIVDQLRNMSAPGDSEHVKYETLATSIRGLGKQYEALTISLGQAGGEAEDQAILNMNHVYGSKTGIQGTADVIIGVGATYQMMERGELIMSPCKNKLSGNHKPFKLRMDKQKSKVY